MEKITNEVSATQETKPIIETIDNPVQMPNLDDIESGAYTFDKETPKEETPKEESRVGMPKKEAEVKEKDAIIARELKKEDVDVDKDPQKYKIKVDGKEEELSMDEIIRLAQMGKSAHQRFQEAANIKKQIEPIMKALKEDPYYLLTHPELGIDERKFREATEKWLAEKILIEQMPEEQRELYLAKIERDKLLKEKEEAQIKKEQERLEQMEQKYAEEYERQFVEALEKVNVPKEPRVVARMAEYMQKAIKNRVSLTAQDAALLVKEDLARENAAVISAMSPEELVGYVGKDNVEKIRKYLISQVKNDVQEPNTRKETLSHKRHPKKENVPYPTDKGLSGFKKYLDDLEEA